MKIWRFYLKPDEETDTSNYELYAITNNKEKAHQFMSERDMNKFYTRCTHEDAETFTVFVNDNRALYLDYHKLMTAKELPNGLTGKKSVEVLCTEYEYQSSCDEGAYIYINTEEYWLNAIHPKAYSKALYNALSILEYNSYFKLFKNSYPMFDSLSSEHNMDELTVDDDYSAPDVSIDELGMFIQTFYRTFK